ncbi:MAG TPA: 7,8-didemethyl-8-hydroxy-5-deazariboflavin synthase CofG [Methylomirabilota bacterium]|jgi:7,8-didemethyl-8-hydroxy-5-deazariboflavin synthase CofG subunit|nr:7,8-didemethyl-8-hydroxy-5-deazariboflavin synthase CofG [Methylomirabilota bacterium]
MAVLELTPIDRALERLAEGRTPDAAEATALLSTPTARLPLLLDAAAALRDRGRGRRITFSAKVFIPLTTLCRDYCGYCTFRKDPGEPGAFTMSPDQVLALASAGARLGAKEALFSLGDKPEALFAEHRAFLRSVGHRSTLGYLRAVSARVLEETGLLPHANPGLMTERDLASLREVNVSMGIMLESTSTRLLAPGAAHDRAPDKVPERRLRTIARAGALSIPFTTGILIGIGETHAERVESLLAIRALHERYGHIQEVIIQNFRAKPTIPMRDWPDPVPEDLLRTVAVARLLLGPDMNIQAPPNLSAQGYDRLPAAGLNDWGGISPLTPDHINPERPWPGLAELRRRTESAGHELRERLAVYPEYATRAAFLDERLRDRVSRAVDPDGLVRPDLEVWRRW